ncbi:C-type lectin domain family 5 member A-like [Hyperolius riggenbachi]|uniref:C-type lectin domain family 5 member A-like n=1 Tax=Hyperolius riggenbachi TaxID=752182 RepID=UPI0035A3CDE8
MERSMEMMEQKTQNGHFTEPRENSNGEDSGLAEEQTSLLSEVSYKPPETDNSGGDDHTSRQSNLQSVVCHNPPERNNSGGDGHTTGQSGENNFRNCIQGAFIWLREHPVTTGIVVVGLLFIIVGVPLICIYSQPAALLTPPQNSTRPATTTPPLEPPLTSAEDSTTLPATRCPLDMSQQYKNKCYCVSNNSASWEEGQKNCKAKGGSLMTLDDTTKGFLVDELQNPPDLWLSLRKDPDTGEWKWKDGTVYNGTVLHDNGLQNKCAIYDKGNVIAFDCTTERIYYICEKSL